MDGCLSGIEQWKKIRTRNRSESQYGQRWCVVLRYKISKSVNQSRIMHTNISRQRERMEMVVEIEGEGKTKVLIKDKKTGNEMYKRKYL